MTKKRLNYSLKNTETDSISDKMVMVYKKSQELAGDEYLRDIFSKIENMSNDLTVAIRRDKEKSELRVLDRKRDALIRKLQTLIKGHCEAIDPNVSEKARKVLSVFSKYGIKITRENYDSKSSLISSLLDNLNNDTIRDCINQLQYVGDTIQLLRQAENEFVESAVYFNSIRVAGKKLDSATDIKRNLVTHINSKLISYLEVKQDMKNENYERFTNEIYELIDTANKYSANRKTKKDDSSENNANATDAEQQAEYKSIEE